MHYHICVAAFSLIAACHLQVYARVFLPGSARDAKESTLSEDLVHNDEDAVKVDAHPLSRRATPPPPPPPRGVLSDTDESTQGDNASLADTVMWDGPFPADDATASDYTDFEDEFHQRLPSWYTSDGKQKHYTTLNPSERVGILREADKKGVELKSMMDNYVSRRQSRLVETKSDQESNVDLNYEINQAATKAYKNFNDINPQMSEIFVEAGITQIDLSKGFGSVTYMSKPKHPSGQPVLSVGVNPDQGAILSVWSFAEWDTNDKGRRAFSSTLTWSAWRKVAGDKSRGLKYQIRDEITNQATNNIMSLIHETWDNRDNAIPKPYPTYPNGSSMGPVAGHGTWTPSHPVFQQLLAMPNVAICVQMIADYNTDMDNPYITAIHTFPPVSRQYFPNTYDDHERAGYVIIEYGQMPGTNAGNSPKPGISPFEVYKSQQNGNQSGPGSSSNQGTVQTS